MTVEIDQSNKIEKTNKNTVIGLSNDRTFTVLIPARVKRQLQEEFRKQGKPRLFVYRTFIAGVVLLLKYAKVDYRTPIFIDEEYSGYERLLRSMFAEMWGGFSEEVPTIDFKRVGKKSGAHLISYKTMKGRQKPDCALSFGEIKRLVLN
ncbi:MAG TPA: hypothetical protein VGA53_00540 [Candidatus Paceibacterota bacterium]